MASAAFLLCLIAAILQAVAQEGATTTYKSTTTYTASTTCTGTFIKEEVFAYTQQCLTAYSAETVPGDATLWIDAQNLPSMTIVSGIVSAWASLRGTLTFTSAYGNSLPLYCSSCFASGQPGVNFAASGGGLATATYPLPSTGDATVIFVGTMGSAALDWAGLFEHGDSDIDLSLERTNSAKVHFQTANDNAGNEVTASPNTPYIYIATMAGGTARTLLQVSATGVEQTSTGSNLLTMQKGTAKKIYLMTSDRTDTQRSYGIAAEVIYFQRVLSASEISSVKNYLKTKWFGLSVAGGSVTTAVALTPGLITSSNSNNATYSRRNFVDAACATPSTPALVVSNDPGLNAQYSKCTPAATGGGSLAVSYSTTRPRLPDTQGIVWSGFATTAACLAGQAPLWYNFTQAGACVAAGTGSAVYTCDRQNLYVSTYSDAACKTIVGTKTTTTFASIKTSACATPNPARSDNSHQFTRATCRAFAAVPTNVMDVYTFPAPPTLNTGAWVTHVYHLGKNCKSAPLSYKVDSVVLNKCFPPDDTHATYNYNFECKRGKNKYTITRYDYGPQDSRCAAGVVDETVWEHDHDCKEDDVYPGVFVSTVCGAFPFISSAAEHLLFREYSDEKCLFDAVSRGVLMGVCEPVYGPPYRRGANPAMSHRRKLVYIWTDTLKAGPTVSVAEQRYVSEDDDCIGR